MKEELNIAENTELDRISGTPGFDPVRWLDVCRRYPLTLLLCVAVAVAATAGLSLIAAPVYRSSAIVGLTRTGSDYFGKNRDSLFWRGEDMVTLSLHRSKASDAGDRPTATLTFESTAGNIGGVRIDIQGKQAGLTKTVAATMGRLFIERAAKLDPGTIRNNNTRRQTQRVLAALTKEEQSLKARKADLAKSYSDLKEAVAGFGRESAPSIQLSVLNSQVAALRDDVAAVDDRLLEAESAAISARGQLDQALAAEGAMSLVSVDGPERVKPRTLFNSLVAALAAFLAGSAGLYARDVLRPTAFND